jgi:hypothetical protein
VDQDGVLQSASGHFPVPQVSIADRPYMVAFRDGRWELMVGETLRGRVNGNDLFTVARPLVGADGRLTGAILVAAYPSYFQDLYRRSAPDMDPSASLVRADGAILVRDAHTSTKQISAGWPTDAVCDSILWFSSGCGSWRANPLLSRAPHNGVTS